MLLKNPRENKFYFHMHNSLMGRYPLEKLWLANTEAAEVIVQLKIELVGGPDGKGMDCKSIALQSNVFDSHTDLQTMPV